MAGATEHAFPGGADSRTQSRQQFYVGGEDGLRIRVFNSFVAGDITITGRHWDEAAGKVQVFEENLHLGIPADDQTIERLLPKGVLLNLRVATTPASSMVMGDVFARAQIIRGLGTSAKVLATILQGYFSRDNDIGWPGSVIQSEHEGRGRIKDAGWLPGPGVSLSRFVNAGERWRVIAGNAIATMSGVVATRQMFLQIMSPLNLRIYERVFEAGLAAGQASGFSFGGAVDGTSAAIVNPQCVSLPIDLELETGCTINMILANPQAGDVFNAPGALYVRSFFDH